MNDYLSEVESLKNEMMVISNANESFETNMKRLIKFAFLTMMSKNPENAK